MLTPCLQIKWYEIPLHGHWPFRQTWLLCELWLEQRVAMNFIWEEAFPKTTHAKRWWLASITLFVRAAVVSIFIHGITTFHPLSDSMTRVILMTTMGIGQKRDFTLLQTHIYILSWLAKLQNPITCCSSPGQQPKLLQTPLERYNGPKLSPPKNQLISSQANAMKYLYCQGHRYAGTSPSAVSALQLFCFIPYYKCHSDLDLRHWESFTGHQEYPFG